MYVLIYVYWSKINNNIWKTFHYAKRRDLCVYVTNCGLLTFQMILILSCKVFSSIEINKPPLYPRLSAEIQKHKMHD